MFNESVQELQPWLCPQHPLALPRLVEMESCSGKVPWLCLCPSGGAAGGDSWGPVDGLSCSCSSCGCVTVCVCCLNSFQFGSASIPGQQRTPMAGRWDDLPTFRCSCAPRDANVSDVSALAPSPLSTHRGFTWLNFMG